MRHSYSALQKLQNCERAYYYAYKMNFASDKPQSAASLRGNAWHAVVQAALIWEGVKGSTLLEVPEQLNIVDGLAPRIVVEGGLPRVEVRPGEWHELVPETVVDLVAWWWEGLDSDRRAELEAAYGAPLAERLADLWTRYSQRWGDEDHVYPLLVETRWVRPAPNGRDLMGYVDAVVLDTEMHMVVVRDYKSHESWPTEPDHILDLMDSQLHLQAWGVAPQLRERGLKPQAVEFDRVRFKKPATPKLTTKGALSKSVTDYDAYTYRNFCASAEAVEAGYEFDAAHWQEKADELDRWFRRSRKPLSMPTVTAHVLAAAKQAERAEVVTEKAPISPGKHCSWCDFAHLCRAEIVGGRPEPLVLMDYGLRKRTRFGR